MADVGVARAEPQVWHVRERVDVYVARRQCRTLALAMGFSRQDAGQLEIVASELAWNVLKHGLGGRIELRARQEGPEPALEIRAFDEGLPLKDLDRALRDGWDDGQAIDPLRLIGRGGLGVGLGAVVRLTDSFRYEPQEHGKCFVALRYLRCSAPESGRR